MVSPLPSPIASVTTKPRPETPWWLYLVGILGAGVIGAASAYPKIFLVLIVLSAVVTLFIGALRNPWIALAIIIAQYPVMNTLRTIYTAYHLPVFASGVRFFPDFLQFVILAQLLIRAIKDPRYRLKVYGDDLSIVTYIVVGIYSVIIAIQYTNPYGPINGWYLSMTPPLFYLVIRWLQPTRELAKWFLGWMTACYCVLMAISLPAYFIRPVWYRMLQNAEHGHFVPKGVDPMVFWHFYPRMEGFLFEENHWGALSELVAVLTAAYLMRPGSPYKRYLLFFLATLSMVCSISRGAMISFVIAMFLLLLHWGLHQRRILAIGAVMVAAAGIALFVMRDTPLVRTTFERLDTVGLKAAEKGELGGDRVHQWRAGWRIFVLTPSGMGLGTVGNGAALSKVTQFVVGDGEYVRVLAEQGVPGIIAFAFMILSIPWMLWRYRNICPVEWRPLGVGLFSFHFGFCVQAIGANTFDYYCVCPVYFMLLGLYMSMVHRHLQEQKSRASLPALSNVPLLPSAGV